MRREEFASSFPDIFPNFEDFVLFLAPTNSLNNVRVVEVCLALEVSSRKGEMYAVVEVRTCYQTYDQQGFF
jgi:hypothetical protein